MTKLGIIAAKGSLSKQIIEHARIKSEIFVIAINNETDPSIIQNIDHIWINLGEIGKAINAMKTANVTEVVFVGSLKKPDIFDLKVDLMGAKLLAKIVKNKFFGDDKLLSSVTKFLEENGFRVIGAHEILKNLVVDEGIFTKQKPNKQDQLDIELASKVVKELGALDVGQGAIIDHGIVLGVEAVEGTDQLIERCAKLKRNNKHSGVLVKLSKPGQELRMDLPTIGINTVKNIHIAGLKGIVIEAKKAIFLDQKEVIEYANNHQIFICSIKL